MRADGCVGVHSFMEIVWYMLIVVQCVLQGPANTLYFLIVRVILIGRDVQNRRPHALLLTLCILRNYAFISLFSQLEVKLNYYRVLVGVLLN